MSYSNFIQTIISQKLRIVPLLDLNEKKILLITGDPNSVNSEIICKTLKN